MSDEEFEQLVNEGIDSIPERFVARLENVAIVIADEPTPSQRKENHLKPGSTLLGLYQGVPLTMRGDHYGGMVIPDKITIFKNPILSASGGDKEAIRELVRSTVWHEIAHYFGYDDNTIREREQRGENFSE